MRVFLDFELRGYTYTKSIGFTLIHYAMLLFKKAEL